MAAIRLTDIQINTAFLQYVIARTATLSALVKSGIVGVDAAVAAAVQASGFGGKLVNLPFWNDITGDDEVLSDNPEAPLTAGGITFNRPGRCGYPPPRAPVCVKRFERGNCRLGSHEGGGRPDCRILGAPETGRGIRYPQGYFRQQPGGEWRGLDP